jgi:hypothetical protein
MFFMQQAKNKKANALSILLLVVVWLFNTFTTDGIIDKQLCYYGECLKLVTIGTLLFIPLLALTKNYATGN